MKRTIKVSAVFSAMMLLAVAADAGVLEVIKTSILGSPVAIVAWIVGPVLMVIGKLIPNDKLETWFKAAGKGIGVTITLGAASWKWTKPIWNKTIEPFIIDLILYGGIAFFQGLILGMKSDNT